MRRKAATAVSAVIACIGLAIACPVASARPGVIVSPRAGATVVQNAVRVIISAGDEYNDVDARLNGKEVGGQFTRAGHGLRVLLASDSDGLRYGTNILRVTATRGLTVRHATVRFRVVTRRLLVGAGEDLRVPVGTLVHLDGLIRLQSRRARAARTRWTLVSVPAGSRFARHRPRRAAESRATLNSPPIQVVDDPLRPTGRADAPVATFTPDALGSYRVKLTSAVGSDTVSNEVNVEVVPRSPVVTVGTDVGTGIRVGDQIIPAAPMARDASGAGRFSGTTADGFRYHATYQVLALDRSTLAVIWNRTYGQCNRSGTLNYSLCRLKTGQKEPVPVNAEGELKSLGEGAVVIASSHSGGAAGGAENWGAPDASTAEVLEAIGGPSDRTVLNGATAGGVSAIGTPNAPADSADIKVVKGGDGGMWGYLGADPNQHFAFMPSARVDFDTAPPISCSGPRCTVTQTVGEETATVSVPKGDAGYFVSAYDPHSLKLMGSENFAMVSQGQLTNPVTAMSTWVGGAASVGDVILIRMYRTVPMGRPLPGYGMHQTTGQWRALAAQIAALGGTPDTFNRSAASTTALYSVIGWGGAGEGKSSETMRGNGRIRGTLVPDNRSMFRPAEVSADGPPADQLSQIIVRPVVTRWPLDNDPAAHRALQWLGAQIPALGPSPRTAYWYTDIDQAKAASIIDQLRHTDYPSGQGFSAAAFGTARDELVKEVGWVGNVRDYLAKLATPEDQAGHSAWEDASKLNHDLTSQLQQLKEKADVEFSWLNVAASILELAGGFSEIAKAEELAHLVGVLASSTLLTGEVFDKTWNGAPANDAERTVEADQLATELEQEAKRTVEAYDRMGDMIVSDPTKLAELGKWAGCDPAGSGCDNGKYAEFALPKGATRAAGAMALRAVDRVLYERLVPLAFGVWNTGTAHDPNPSRFSCLARADDPFRAETPPQAYASVLSELDPDHPGDQSFATDNEWTTYMTVARSGQTYAWPSKALLARMYGPASTSDNANEGGLGISPQEFLPTAKPEYVPGGVVDCGWDNSRNP